MTKCGSFDEKFEKLKLSIQENPEMLKVREIVVYDNNGELVIVGGNMRYRALKELKEKKTYIKILPQNTSLDKLKAFFN